MGATLFYSTEMVLWSWQWICFWFRDGLSIHSENRKSIQSNEEGNCKIWCLAFNFLILDPAVVTLLLLTALERALAEQLAGLVAVTSVLKANALRILAGGVAGADALAFVTVHAINLTRLRGTAWGLADLAVDASVGGGMLGIVFVAVISNIASSFSVWTSTLSPTSITRNDSVEARHHEEWQQQKQPQA